MQRSAIPWPLGLAACGLGFFAMVSSVSTLALAGGPRFGLVGAEVVLVLPALLALVAWGIPLRSGLGWRVLPSRGVLLSVLLGGALWATSLGLFEVQSILWPPSQAFLESFRQLHEALHPSGPLDALASVVAIAIAPACCEEILFRGVALPSFATLLGRWGAAFLSSLLFGLIHYDFATHSLYRVPFAFSVGMGLAAVRLATGSVIPSILAHATLNTITFAAVAPFVEEPLETTPNAWMGVPLLVAGSLAFAFLYKKAAVDLAKSAP